MLKNTFCHVPGVGLRTEEILWDSHIRSWERLMESSLDGGPLTKGKMRMVQYHIQESLKHLEAGDARYFGQLLASDQQWRLFPDFRRSVAYLDIETTGMGGPYDHITTIALYDGHSIFTYVHEDNLLQFREDIRNYDMIVTYNGKGFDVPFIRNTLHMPMDQVHIDLRFVLKSLGYRGGLKGCEKQLGLDRGDLDGVDGFFAVLLWQEYQRHHNEKALETLLAYNIEDAVNLEVLAVRAYNMKLEQTPFRQTHLLPVPATPAIPFKAHRPTIEGIRGQIQRFGVF